MGSVETTAGGAETSESAYGHAVDSYRAAIAEQPEDPGLWLALGTAYEKLGQYEGAAQSFQRALELRTSDANSQFELGQALFHLGRYQEAEAAYRRAIELEPKHLKALGATGLTR